MDTTVRTLVLRGRDWNQSKEKDRVKRNSRMEDIGVPMQRKTRSLNMLAAVVAVGMMAALSGCAYPTGYSTAHAAEWQAPGSYYGYSRYRYVGGYGYYPYGQRSHGYYYGGYHRYRH